MVEKQCGVSVAALLISGLTLLAVTNVPVLNLEDETTVVVSNVVGWTYALQYTTNLTTVTWYTYPQSHVGRGVTEKWRMDIATAPQQCFYKAAITNYTAGATAATGTASILHYPSQAQTGRVWRTAIYMVNTVGLVTNTPSTPILEWYTPEKLGELYFRDPMGANAFLQDASGGMDNLSGTVIGWLEEPEQNLSASDISGNPDYYFGLGHSYIRYVDYDVHVMHARVKGVGQQTGWLYPQQSLNTPQGAITGIGINWMINSAVFDLAPLLASNWSSDDSILPTVPWIHEFIHTMGISGHANSYDCGTNTISEVTTNNPIKAYGNPFSVMGERAYATHPDAFMKYKLGWISSEQIQSVVSNGTYAITPLELADGLTKAITLPINPPITNKNHSMAFDRFMIEYRRPIGFDTYLKRLDGSTFLSRYKPVGTVTNNGVLVYLLYPDSAGTDGTLLLDMHPTSPYDATRGIKIIGNAGKFADAMLNIGETFTWRGLTVTPTGTNALGAMQITISL